MVRLFVPKRAPDAFWGRLKRERERGSGKISDKGAIVGQKEIAVWRSIDIGRRLSNRDLSEGGRPSVDYRVFIRNSKLAAAPIRPT